jgi:hypothetical protein
MSEVIHKTYLPYTAEEVAPYLAEAIHPGARDGVNYFIESIGRYNEYHSNANIPAGDLRKSMRVARQFEKDERFWTAACLIKFEKAQSTLKWIELLKKAFDGRPSPLNSSWEDLVAEPLKIRLEAPLPSPAVYVEWLKKNVSNRNFIPYVIEAAKQKRVRLEGFTHADAIAVCEKTGFGVVFEAKATADQSYSVSFDLMRNQIARVIDVMLEPPAGNPNSPLSKRKAEETLFVLLTPGVFKKHWRSRLYGWLMHDYQENPGALARDLPHRSSFTECDWERLSKRIGWLSWEDCNAVLPQTCPWFKDGPDEI